MRDFEIAQTDQSLATFTHAVDLLNIKYIATYQPNISRTKLIGAVLENGTGLSGQCIVWKCEISVAFCCTGTINVTPLFHPNNAAMLARSWQS